MSGGFQDEQLLPPRHRPAAGFFPACGFSSELCANDRHGKDAAIADHADTATAKPTTSQEGSPKPPPPGSTGKPLSVNEDPAMIGKRNINKGIICQDERLDGEGSQDRPRVGGGSGSAGEICRRSGHHGIRKPRRPEHRAAFRRQDSLHHQSIDSDEVNAFALPGGFFYVNKGLLLVADNEAEVAGVMAHEIAHVAARHAVENQTKASLLEYLAMGTSIFLGGIPGMIYQNTAGLGLLGIFMKFSRSAEEEADKLGVQYMYAAGLRSERDGDDV